METLVILKYRNEDTVLALLYIEWKHCRNGHTTDCKKEMETISSQNIVKTLSHCNFTGVETEYDCRQLYERETSRR